MKVTLGFLLLTYLTVSTVLGISRSPIEKLRKGSILECSNGKQFEVADIFYTDGLVCVAGVKEAGENTNSGSGVKATAQPTSVKSPPHSPNSTETEHKECYSIPTLYVVKIAPKEVVAAEVKFLKTNSNGFAELLGDGHLPDNLAFYIMTRYGPNLKRVLQEFHNNLSIGTILGIGADMMDHFEVLHKHNPTLVWKTFDLSNIHLTGKEGSKQTIYLAGFKSIGQPEDHIKQSKAPTKQGAPSKGNVGTKQSAVNNIKTLANELVKLSSKNEISFLKFKERNKSKQLTDQALMENWIGKDGQMLYPFVKAVYDLKPDASINYKHLKGLLTQHPISWDWETEKWNFQWQNV